MTVKNVTLRIGQEVGLTVRLLLAAAHFKGKALFILVVCLLALLTLLLLLCHYHHVVCFLVVHFQIEGIVELFAAFDSLLAASLLIIFVAKRGCEASLTRQSLYFT